MAVFGLTPSVSEEFYPLDSDTPKDTPGSNSVPPNAPHPPSSGSSFSEPLAASVYDGDSVFDPTTADPAENLVATQPLSQSQHYVYNPNVDEDLVGVLLPATSVCNPFELRKDGGCSWTIGRASNNNLVLPGVKLSNFHCRLDWNGCSGKQSEVALADNSTNGTWVNNVYLRRGQTAILRSGAVISLGGRPEEPLDWRFIYRDVEGQSTRHAEQFWSKYDLGHELGSGTFARVHRCVERETSTPYAVKIINKSKLGHSPRNEQNFIREIVILRRLSEFRHKNIVALREHFEEEDSIYLVMELVRGGDLLSYIGAQGAMPEQEVRRMAAQMCHAIAYVHSQGIAHRDLKPENIMITAENPPNCKVADFGLAKLVDSGTYLKTMCGTPAYLAPEVILRESLSHAYDNRVDSWSLGVIIFCMLTNHSPFLDAYDANMSDASRRIYFQTRQVDWRVLHQCQVSDDCYDFLRCLLEQDPRNRREVQTMLDHRWISALVPSDSQFQQLPSRPSTPPTTADGVIGACSQSFENLNLYNERTAIPGLSHQPSPSNLPAQESEASVTSRMPGAFPKECKDQPHLEVVNEIGSGAQSWELGHSVTQVPAKRKDNPIAGSSPLTSLSDSDSDSPSPPPPPPPPSKRPLRRAPTPHVRKLHEGHRTRASSSKRLHKNNVEDRHAHADFAGRRGTRRTKVPRLS